MSAGPKFYDMSREEAMEHMFKVASIQRRSPEVYNELVKEGFTTKSNLIDYIQGQVRLAIL